MMLLKARKVRQGSERGMSLIELMIGIVILAVGMSALLGLIVTAIANDNKAKTDTGSTLAAELVIETVAGKRPVAGAMTVTLQDCVGNNLVVDTTDGAAPGAGALLDATGAIDWINQTNAGVPAGYKMQYRSCAANGVQTTYDVRWNIRTLTPYSKLVTVSARPIGATNANGTRTANKFERPVLLRTVAVSGN